MTNFIINDGGRELAGYKGSTGDCVTRAIAIATGKSYQEVYDTLHMLNVKYSEKSRSKAAKKIKNGGGLRGTTPRNGVFKAVYHPYILSLGATWTPTMLIGQGCKVHLRAEELPKGILIVSVSKHLTTMIDGVINDTFNPSREGSGMSTKNGVTIRKKTGRCVYGYYSF